MSARDPSPFTHTPTADAAWARGLLGSEPDLMKLATRERLVGALRGVPGALVLGVTFGGFLVYRHPDVAAIGVIVGVVMALLLLMYAMRGGRWATYVSELAAVSSTAGPSYDVRAAITDEGIRWEARGTTTIVHWRAISRVVRFRDYVILESVEAGAVYSVPLAAFENAADADAWEREVRDRLDAAGCGETARALAAVEANPVNCGRCGHSLRGLRDARCPECGTGLSELRVQMWSGLQRPVWSAVFKGLS